MRDYGTTTFRPGTLETREYLARALVRAFAPTASADFSVTFSDLSQSDPFFRYASVAVRRGWMQRFGTRFLPTRPVTTVGVHRALVWALGLASDASGLSRLSTADGFVFHHRVNFGSLALGMVLGFRYDHLAESLDVGPDTQLSRAEVAWSLHQAKLLPSWKRTAAAAYATIRLPALSQNVRDVVQFGIRWIGYPYIFGGEWGFASPAGYCCGTQPQGGFDCSGLMWWLLKAPVSGYDPSFVRPYAGWPLDQRTADEMAKAAPTRLTYMQAAPGDLLFYDANGDGIADHVDLKLGNGWALDSTGSDGGVAIIPVGTGWYQTHFTWARRLVG
jgi:cell wall-associated NlpC family hydrolase